MAKTNGLDSIRFQAQHSRNAHDWTLSRAGNRFTLQSDGKGVRYRIGVVASFVKRNPNCNSAAMLAKLQKLGSGYTAADLQQPIKVMCDNGWLEVLQGTKGTVYKLTRLGEQVF